MDNKINLTVNECNPTVSEEKPYKKEVLEYIKKTAQAVVILIASMGIQDTFAGELDINSINLPAGGAEVTLSSGEKVTLQKSNGEFIIKPNSSSLNGTDHFEGTFTTNGVVFRVISNSVENGVVSIEEYKSKIGVDYLELTSGDKKLANILLKGEIEFFNNIDNKAFQIALDKQGMGGLKEEEYKELWVEIANTIGLGKIDQRQLDLLKKGSPNMLLGFTSLDKRKYKVLKLVGDYQESIEDLEMAKRLRGY